MSSTGSEPLPVEPLGVLAPRRPPALTGTREALRVLSGGLGQDLREPVARYLRQGAVIFAFMEHTRDVLEGRFGVPGGSGLLSDGTYYWRLDAADYVEAYGTGIPDEALRHMRAHGWTPPQLDRTTQLRIDAYLSEELGASDAPSSFTVTPKRLREDR